MENTTEEKSKNEKAIKKHKKIYGFFMILTILGFFDLMTKLIIDGSGGTNDVGLIGRIVYNLTGVAVFISILQIIFDFWFFWLIFALLERRHLKKLEKQKNDKN